MAFQDLFLLFIFALVLFNVNLCLVYCLLWAYTSLAGITFTDPDIRGSSMQKGCCNRAVAKNHKAVQCDICDKWIHSLNN